MKQEDEKGLELVTLSVKVPFLKISNKRMKRGGAGNAFSENAVFEDRKPEDERGGARNPLGENAVFEDMKPEDERGGAGNPLGENVSFWAK